MERNLRALRERPEQNKDQHRQIGAVRPDGRSRRKHGVDVIAARDPAEQQEADEHADTAEAGHDQGHSSAIASGLIVMPISNEQEGKEAGQLPEKSQLDEIAREDDAEHRAHESLEKGEEARNGILRRHVVTGIEDHQRAHAEYEQGEKPRKTVEPQRELEAERRKPGGFETHDLASRNSGIKGGKQPDSGEGDCAGEGRSPVPPRLRQGGRNDAAEKGKAHHRQKVARVIHRG